MKNISVKKIKGFTLIETLVSVFIITTVILGPLTVSINALNYARETKDIMTGTFLAEEALELLHYHQDTIYVKCISGQDSGCTPSSGQKPSEKAWHIFRDSLSGTSASSNISCFVSENANGCAFDYQDIINGGISSFSKYLSTQGGLCTSLSYNKSTDQATTYLCTEANGQISGYSQSQFSRRVLIEVLPTYGSSGSEDQYQNSDLRAVSRVTIKRANGFTREIKIVDFFHAKG